MRKSYDKKTAPINVLQIGNFQQFVFGAKMETLKPKSMVISNDVIQRKTRITISFSQAQMIDNISLQIGKPNFYKRNARILVKVENPKHKIDEDERASFELNSNQKNSFDFPMLYEKELIIEIDNEDNPNLEIKSLSLNQLPIYLVADLKSNESYVLKTGNLTLRRPNYDIEYFKKNISKQLPEATLSKLIIRSETATLSQNLFWQKPWFMWLCIAFAGATILYFSSNLLKEMK